MSKVLVVQPHKMLQQAIVVALFPEHQVQVLERIPATDPSAEVDVVIIDAGALDERGTLSADEVQAVQSWQTPIIWIGSESARQRAASKNRLQLAAPIKREELRAAVAESLRSRAVEPHAAEPATKRSAVVSARKKTAEPKADSLAADNEKEVIELVDVFEEISIGGDGEAEAK
jgi:hypothetical protein